MTNTGRSVSFTAVLVFLGAACGGYQPPAQPGPAQASAAQVMIGTCRTVEGNRFDLITGLAEALKVEWFRTDQSTEIIVNGRPARLTDITAGTVVRVRYRVGPDGYVAERVETTGTYRDGGGA